MEGAGQRGRWTTAAVILAACVVLLPSFFFGPPAVDSGAYNYSWTLQFGEALARGEWYPRWLPRSNDGFGSPTFYFYPPLAFYLSGAIHLLGVPVWQAINVAGLLALAASGLTMARWLREVGGHPAGAVLFVVAPYHLGDFYTRAAFAEFVAYLWLPVIALAMTTRHRWSGPVLALAYAGLIGTHLPLAVLTGVLLMPPLALHAAWRLGRADLRFLAERAGWALLGVGLSAVYLVPALTLQSHTSMGQKRPAMFQPFTWSVWHVPEEFRTALLCFASIAAGGVVLAVAAAQRERSVRFWAGLTVGIAALAVGVVPWLWLLPVLKRVEFPWRTLALLEFAAITAWAMRPPSRVLVGVALLVATFGIASQLTWGVMAVRGSTLELRRQIAADLWDPPEYLPPTFRQRATEALDHSVDQARLRAFAVQRPGQTVYRQLDFPSWEAERYGVRVPKGKGPLVTVDGEGRGVRLMRRTLPEERAGWWISLGAAAVYAAALITRRRVGA